MTEYLRRLLLAPRVDLARILILSIGLLVVLTVSCWGQEANTPNFYLERGTLLWHRADYDGAISNYTKAIEIDEAKVKAGHADEPDLKRLASTYLIRAKVRRVCRRFDGALADIDRSLQIRPNWAEAYYERGFTYKMAGDANMAVAEYAKAIDINPKYARAYIDRGYARNDLGDSKGALNDFDTGIEIDPTDVQAYFFRGVIRNNRLDHAGAIADYTKMIELAPYHPRGYELRGVLLFALGRPAEAERDLTRCLQLNPEDRPRIEDILNRIKKERKGR